MPRPHRKAFVSLSRLDDEVFSAACASLDSPEPTSSLSELRARVREHLLEDDIDADLLLEALLGASSAKIWRNASSGDVARAVATFPDLEVEPDRREELIARVSALLDSESLATLSKGLDVLTEHERVYLRSRIVTDVRPAYRADETVRPSGIVLIHTLRLDVQESGQVKSIYVAMDETDLQQLRAALDREAEKTAGLKEAVKGLDLPLLDFEESDSVDEVIE